MTDAPQYFYPNRIGRIILTAMQSAMGQERFAEVLTIARLEHLQKLPPNNLERKFPFEWVSGLQEATEKAYGELAGRAMNLRVGRSCFSGGLNEFGPVLGISDLPKRLMPVSMKFRLGL